MKTEEEIRTTHDKLVDLYDGANDLPSLKCEKILNIIQTLEWVLED